MTLLQNGESAGTGDGQFIGAYGIATFSGNSLLVVEFSNHRIQEFSRDGDFITKFGSGGIQPGQFRYPSYVAIDKPTGMHYISDTFGHRIQMFHWDPGVVINPFPDRALPD